jgi:hypothetical protein
MPDFHEAFGEKVQQETADEIDRIRRHRFLLVAVGLNPPAKSDLTIPHFDQASVRDGDTVRVARQTLNDVNGIPEWLFPI